MRQVAFEILSRIRFDEVPNRSSCIFSYIYTSTRLSYSQVTSLRRRLTSFFCQQSAQYEVALFFSKEPEDESEIISSRSGGSSSTGLYRYNESSKALEVKDIRARRLKRCQRADQGRMGLSAVIAS